jgi:hypothetical protein
METIILQSEMHSLTEPVKKARRSRGSDRYPRYERAQGDLPGLGTSPYDPQIFDALYRHRLLTKQQIEGLLAPGAKKTRIGERLQKLYHHGFLERKVMPLNPPTSLIVYLLDRKGADALAVARGCALEDLENWDSDDKDTGTTFVRHTLLVNDAYFTIARSATVSGYALDTWADGRTLKREHKKDKITITVKRKHGGEETLPTRLYPDLYFLLRFWQGGEEKKCHRFLELDNATETVTASVEAPSSWGMKVKRYLAYWEQGKFAARYKANGMVVLALTTNERRLANLKRATEKECRETVQGKRFWFATTKEFFDPNVNVLTDAIWERAGIQGRFTFTEELGDAPV